MRKRSHIYPIRTTVTRHHNDTHRMPSDANLLCIVKKSYDGHTRKSILNQSIMKSPRTATGDPNLPPRLLQKSEGQTQPHFSPLAPDCQGAHGCGRRMQALSEDSFGSENANWKSEVVDLRPKPIPTSYHLRSPIPLYFP